MDEPDDPDECEKILADIAVLAEHSARGKSKPLTGPSGEAFQRLFDRYRTRIYAFVERRICNRMPFIDPEGFTTDLILKFVRHAHKFNPANAHRLPDLEKQFFSTLHLYARYLVSEILKHHLPTVDQERLVQFSIPPIDEPTEAHKAELVKLHAGLEKLHDKARDVIVTSSPYYDVKQRRFLLPHEVKNGLKEKWKIASDNDLVQFRKRAIESLGKMIG